MKLSFIIPALNEEKHITQTLQQFQALEGHFDFEIIVADGDSTDKTRDIAETMGANVYVENIVRNIAAGRNLGAKKAQGDLLIFCDCDTLFENISSFTTKVINSFQDNNIIAATLKIQVFSNERNWKDRAFHLMLNNVIRSSIALGAPFSCGNCQIVRKEEFWRVDGYDETKAHGEDSFLFKKLSKIGKILYFSECVIYESPRRYRQLGHLSLIRQALLSIFKQHFFKKNHLNEWERVN
ncbi:MAG: glycosyltransferase [Ekhidna sp.]|nr:glycosyltransferase [Ekhidna sp.]